MNIRDLKYLIAVAKYQHFGEAAKACYVSQPSLSIQLKRLEEYLGVRLIERTNKKVLVTPLGQQVIEQAKVVVSEFEQLKHMCQDFQNPYHSVLRMGIIPTIAPYVLPAILKNLKQAYPKLKVLVKESQTRVIVDDLQNGELDFLILALPIDCPRSHEAMLYHEPFLLAAPKGHALAKSRSVNETHLENEEIMLLEDGHCFRDQALDLCKKVGAREKHELGATSIETLKHMVAAESGITLIPEKAADSQHDLISYIPFKSPKPVRTVGMVWRESSTYHELLSELQAEIKKMF